MLLPPSLFVNLIDQELSKHLEISSATDPVVLNALQSLQGEVPSQFRSRLSDWAFDAGVLSYKGRVYIPDRDNCYFSWTYRISYLFSFLLR